MPTHQTNKSTTAAAVDLPEAVSEELEVGVLEKQEDSTEKHAGRQQDVGAREVGDAEGHTRLAAIFLLARARQPELL